MVNRFFFGRKICLPLRERFRSIKDMLHLNIHAAHPSVSWEVFNNYFYYQDKLKNMLSFPATISNIFIHFLEA